MDQTGMAYWLLKTEPDCYSWSDFEREKKTAWDGVTNALALKHIRTMKPGDLALVYHTGNQRAAIGLAEVASAPYPNPKEDDERIVIFDLKIKQKLPNPVTLDEIKSDPAFEGFDLIRNSRLSVVPVPPAMWKRIQALSKAAPAR
jgi:predicted RNA-binding protein with PUA-like domain